MATTFRTASGDVIDTLCQVISTARSKPCQMPTKGWQVRRNRYLMWRG